MVRTTDIRAGGEIIGMMDLDGLPPAYELEQLARSLAIDGTLGRQDAQTVADVLRWVAEQQRRRG